MGQRMTVVDAFTHLAFTGNPAAVCVLTESTTDAWMQSVAQEMKHSETAFCIPLQDGTFRLRWFTPGGEVRLCGHATLATAHVLWEEGWLEHRKVARFSTLSGELTAAPLGRIIELDFPAQPPDEVEAPAGLLDSLSVTASWVGRDIDDYVVVLANEAAVKACNPNFDALRSVETRGIIITAAAEQDDVDFVSRFFAPRMGIDEDPVTGSTHCCLAPFWGERLDKTQMAARQLSMRGGELQVELAGDRVKLRGTCVTTLRGNLIDSAPSASSWSRP
ncbi:MAG: PhzF family phenazine biosynthesis protein [Deltaproteobacteria bacterium]|jgi:PhzF family phenazine biosynthesis protein|nr:PhzF family phenazine biosynthesis protein [Deltaproteobacteria bacterium]